jgi:benzil reductase ((S)-benzoin forming)
VKSIRFDSDKRAILVNNAGLIGPLDRFIDAPIESSTNVIEVNLIAVMNLCYSFLHNVTEKRTVINISSGAATRSIPGWAAYCASKAAVDRFSETVQNEINENGQAHRIFSVSPGVIDTPMQEAIRGAQKNQFSSVETFRLLQENNELQSPEDVAQKLIYLALNPEKYDVVLAVRDIQMNV